MSEKEIKEKKLSGLGDSGKTGQVIYERTQCIYRSGGEYHQIRELNITPENSGSLNPEKQHSDTTGDIESLQKLNKKISNTPFENPRPGLVFTKRTEFVLRTPDENNNIRELIKNPRRKRSGY
jgi:hypothetical protein